ncbi:hypothetical protein GE09DRAFT_262535 [Coniochaeta sp. 2T2.1]|nr:hypothetical protein GE09DRAFT_262535 [Coniochaeta sp. 2T2.1]
MLFNGALVGCFMRLAVGTYILGHMFIQLTRQTIMDANTLDLVDVVEHAVVVPEAVEALKAIVDNAPERAEVEVDVVDGDRGGYTGCEGAGGVDASPIVGEWSVARVVLGATFGFMESASLA